MTRREVQTTAAQTIRKYAGDQPLYVAIAAILEGFSIPQALPALEYLLAHPAVDPGFIGHMTDVFRAIAAADDDVPSNLPN